MLLAKMLLLKIIIVHTASKTLTLKSSINNTPPEKGLLWVLSPNVFTFIHQWVQSIATAFDTVSGIQVQVCSNDLVERSHMQMVSGRLLHGMAHSCEQKNVEQGKKQRQFEKGVTMTLSSWRMSKCAD